MKTTTAHILVADDESSFRDLVSAILRSAGHTCDTFSNGVEAMNALQKNVYDLLVLDLNMPRADGREVLKFSKENYPMVEVVMATAAEEISIAVDCMKLGAFDYLSKPFRQDDLLETVGKALERRKLTLDNTVMRSKLDQLVGSSNIVGTSIAVQRMLELAGKVAPTESTVLIQGASGTGKELLANYIYRNSLRAERPFVAINCASIPDALIESELFGHEKGSFTDAIAQKQGLVEIAQRGTLFLDEVGDISPLIQPKLLRFIQTGEFRRVGGTMPMSSDVRIISATNKDLYDEVRAGRFREDLLYRLNVITITMPQLSERREDIPMIAEYILTRKLKTRTKKRISPAAMELLVAAPWRGNVRELENVLERAAILSQGDEILPVDLALPQTGESAGAPPSEFADINLSLEDLERLHISRVLESAKWNKGEAARILGISLKTLYTKISAYRLKPAA
jgi:DNA-binding NtrC family response regulator